MDLTHSLVAMTIKRHTHTNLVTCTNVVQQFNGAREWTDNRIKKNENRGDKWMNNKECNMEKEDLIIVEITGETKN